MVFSFLLSIYWRLEVRMIGLAAISDLFTRLKQWFIADC
jgi:hypothetical protein